MIRDDRIQPKVSHRCCPGCGYLMSQVEIAALKFNIDCPYCRRHKVSEFNPLLMK